MSNGESGERLTKNERREQAREQARQLREEQKKRERRNKVLLQGGIIVGVLAVLVVIALVLVNAVKPQGPGPANMLSGGLLFQPGGQPQLTRALQPDEQPIPSAQDDDEVFHIQTWIDFQCPACQGFEEQNSEFIQGLVDEGAASLEVFPVAILDRATTTRYSSRSANAGACVAETAPASFPAFSDAMFAAQPPEDGGQGLSTDDIIGIAASAGAASQATADCIREERFRSWIAKMTERWTTDPALGNPAYNGGFTTPTIFVNGVRFDRSFSEFRQFLLELDAERGANGSATPSPTPSATPSATPAP